MGEVEQPTPDGVPCRHCGLPIYWDEICWVHEHGFADCGLTMSKGTPILGVGVLDPEIHQSPSFKGKMAEPQPPWS